MDLVFAWGSHDFAEHFPCAADTVLYVIPELPQIRLRKSLFDGPRISEVKGFRFLNCDSKEYDRLGIAMIEKCDQTSFQLDTRIVIEIEEHEETVRSRV